MTKIVSIFGSREGFAPDDSLKIGQIAEFFAKKGWVLRTGGAVGVDEIGLNGFKKITNSKIELYLPWQGYNNHKGILWSQANWDFAAERHPHWQTMNLNSKIFHSRNVSLILGLNNDEPSDLAICWTPGGEEVGGSATGILIAREYKIKIFNLGEKTAINKLRKYVKSM
jgi:hypothetical protein